MTPYSRGVQRMLLPPPMRTPPTAFAPGTTLYSEAGRHRNNGRVR
jgi:hypothetical protein